MANFFSRLKKAFDAFVGTEAPAGDSNVGTEAPAGDSSVGTEAPSKDDSSVDPNAPMIPPPVPGTAGTVTVDGTGAIYGPAVGVNLGNVIYGRDPREDERRSLIWYLDTLAASLNQLPLRGLKTTLDNKGTGIALCSVYVALATDQRNEVARGVPKKLTAYLDEKKVERGGDDLSLAALKQDYHPDVALPEQAIVQIERIERTEVRLLRARLAIEAVRYQQRLVLLGNPGAGKSTFVRHLAWLLAQRELGTLSQNQAKPLAAWQTPTLPVLLPCQKLARRLATHGNDPAAVVVDALTAEIAQFKIPLCDTILREALHRGAALLLFDGLDEVPVQPDTTAQADTPAQADRQTTVAAIRTFAQHYPRVPIVVTSRIRAFTPDVQTTLGWPVETLAPFTLGQVKAFVPAWYGELTARRQLHHETADTLARMLVARVTDNRQLREMSETPLLLTMMALVLYNKGELPRDRPLLYEEILELLLGQWDKMHEGKTLAQVIGKPEWTSKDLRPPLHRLSYEAHQTGSDDGRGRLRREAVRDALIDFFEDARLPDAWEAARRCLDYIEERSGLLMPDENGTYVFAHLTLQEHCAGCHMTLEREDVLDQVMSHRADDRWHVPMMLGLGLADSRDQRDVLEALIDRTEQGQDKPTARWHRDLILAAEIGKDRDWNTLRTRPHFKLKLDGIQANLRTGLVQLLADPAQPLPVAERIRAGFLLGDLGDPRIPVTQEQWRATLPKDEGGRMKDESEPDAPLQDSSLILHPSSFKSPSSFQNYWCYVPAGTYIVGSSDDDPEANDDEKPQHTVTIKQPFYIARYPITNAQWQAWVREAGGTPSRSADDSNFNRPNQPVVSIGWEWCNAFCRWLSEQLGCEVRLPTEAEWEAAARGGDARRYPWGDAWRDDHAATEEDLQTRGWQWNVPVGCYPAGAVPCGALDMAGNVWEWTADIWKSHPGAAKPFENKDWGVLKGGTYYVNRTYVRCAARVGHSPGVGFNELRLLLLPPR